MTSSTYIFCPANKGKGKRNLDVCLQACKQQEECDNFKAVGKDVILENCKRLRISATHFKEIETVIDVEVIPDAPAEVQEVPGDFHESPEAVAVVEAGNQEEEAKKLYAQALGYRKEIESSFWELGITLQKLFLTRHYFGHSTWAGFVENDPLFQSLDLKLRNSDSLRAIPEKFTEFGISREECIKTGKSKLIALLTIVDKKNVKTWLKIANEEGMTARKLFEKISEERGKKKTEKDPGEHTEKLTFHLYPGQREIIDRAIEVAKGIGESDKPAVALQHMAEEFIATFTENDDRLSYLRQITGSIEVSMSVKIDIFDAKTGEAIPK